MQPKASQIVCPSLQDHRRSVSSQRSDPSWAHPGHCRSSHRAADTFQEAGSLSHLNCWCLFGYEVMTVTSAAVSSCFYLSVQCRITMGLLELYDVQRGAKLKYLGSQIAQHFIVSRPVRAFSWQQGWSLLHFTSVQTRNDTGFFWFTDPLQFRVNLSWKITHINVQCNVSMFIVLWLMESLYWPYCGLCEHGSPFHLQNFRSCQTNPQVGVLMWTWSSFGTRPAASLKKNYSELMT